MLTEMADSVGLVMLENGDDPSVGHRRDVQRGDRHGPEGRRRRTDPALHRQRLRPAACEGRPRRGGGLVGRRRAAAGDNPKLKWVIPEKGGMIWTDNMLIPLGGSVADGVDVHELRLRPEDRRADRRVRELRDAGEGCEGGAREDRPRDGEEHAHLPDDETLAQRHAASTPTALNNEDYIDARGRSCSGRSGRCGDGAVGFLPPASQAHALPPARPGDRSGSRSSSSSRWASSGTSRCSPGSSRTTSSRGSSRTTPTRSRSTSEQFVRSFVYAGIATRCSRSLIAYPLATGSRSGPGRWKNLFLARDRRPVLRHVPDPDARLADDPRRRRPGGRRPRTIHVLGAGRRLLATDVRRGRRAHLQLPPLHGAADLRLARADRPAPARGREGPLREPAQAFLRVTLPLSAPGVVAGTLLTFIPAAGDFINAQLLGGPQPDDDRERDPGEVPGARSTTRRRRRCRSC